jgi:signal transduction histidine kinase
VWGPVWGVIVGLAALTTIFLLLDVPVETVRLWGEWVLHPLVILPGSLLAAWGLRRQAQHIREMGLPTSVIRWLQAAGFAFGAFGVVAGVVFPLPGSDVTWLEQLSGVPGQVPMVLAGGLLAVTMSQALRVFRHEKQRLLAEAARRDALAAERERISHDLHDGTLQAIYGTGLVLDAITHLIESDPEDAVRQLRAVTRSLDTTILGIRHYLLGLAETPGPQGNITVQSAEQAVSKLTPYTNGSQGQPLDGALPSTTARPRTQVGRLAPGKKGKP